MNLYLKNFYPDLNFATDVTIVEELTKFYIKYWSLQSKQEDAYYDEYISKKLGYVMCGGELSAPSEVSEQYLLDLEREVFLSLTGEKKTLERIQSILTTGKPVRN